MYDTTASYFENPLVSIKILNCFRFFWLIFSHSPHCRSLRYNEDTTVLLAFSSSNFIFEIHCFLGTTHTNPLLVTTWALFWERLEGFGLTSSGQSSCGQDACQIEVRLCREGESIWKISFRDAYTYMWLEQVWHPYLFVTRKGSRAWEGRKLDSVSRASVRAPCWRDYLRSPFTM